MFIYDLFFKISWTICGYLSNLSTKTVIAPIEWFIEMHSQKK